MIQPDQDFVLATALAWVASMLTGTIGTAIGILAFAALGLPMLQGRMQFRNLPRIVLGCFILFNAHYIAKSLSLLAEYSMPPLVNQIPIKSVEQMPQPLDKESKTNPYEYPGLKNN